MSFPFVPDSISYPLLVRKKPYAYCCQYRRPCVPVERSDLQLQSLSGQCCQLPKLSSVVLLCSVQTRRDRHHVVRRFSLGLCSSAILFVLPSLTRSIRISALSPPKRLHRGLVRSSSLSTILNKRLGNNAPSRKPLLKHHPRPAPEVPERPVPGSAVHSPAHPRH